MIGYFLRGLESFAVEYYRAQWIPRVRLAEDQEAKTHEQVLACLRWGEANRAKFQGAAK